MARFYANENFPLPVVLELRTLGHDVLTSLEAGNANKRIPDDEVLAFAASAGRALLTLNRRDFIRLHRAGVAHEGVVACTSDTDYSAQAERIVEEIGKVPDLKNALVRVKKPA